MHLDGASGMQASGVWGVGEFQPRKPLVVGHQERAVGYHERVALLVAPEEPNAVANR
jgi:hypothetical protein